MADPAASDRGRLAALFLADHRSTPTLTGALRESEVRLRLWLAAGNRSAAIATTKLPHPIGTNALQQLV